MSRGKVFVNSRDTTKKLTVLIAGAHGFIGRSLCSVFENRGFEVTFLGWHTERMNTIGWDFLDDRGLVDFDAVISVNGSPIFHHEGRDINEWDESVKTAIEQSRIGPAAQLAKYIRESKKKPAVFITASMANYYPFSESKVYTEDWRHPVDKRELEKEDLRLSYWSRLSAAWEKAANVDPIAGLQHSFKDPNAPHYNNPFYASTGAQETQDEEINKCRVVNVRLGAVLDKYGGMYRRFHYLSNKGMMRSWGSGKQTLPWIHLEDACEMFVHAAVNNIEGPLNAVAPDMVDVDTIAKGFAEVGGSRMYLPFRLSAADIISRLGAVRAQQLLMSTKVLPQRALDTGFEFKHPTFELAVQDMKKPEWWRSEYDSEMEIRNLN